MPIRFATDRDRDHVRRVHVCAFPAGEGGIISRLAIDLLSEESTPQTFALVAEIDDVLVGHVAFSPVTIDNNNHFQGYILAPLGVKPAYQRRRIGSHLIEDGIQELSAMGTHIVFVYGDPQYYGRFGFSADAADQYVPPYKLQYPFGWQAVVTNEYDIGKTPVVLRCVPSLCDSKLW